MRNETSFTKGDPRINRNGRPKKFDELRALALEIAAEKDEETGLPRARAILTRWATSKRTEAEMNFIQVAFGKVPDEVKFGDTPIKIVVEYGTNGKAK